MNDPIQQAEKQALRYWYVDGLSEIAAGVILLIIAIYFFLIDRLPLPDSANWVTNTGELLLLGALVVAAKYAVQALKERITYPRTGYVALRRGSHTQRLVAGAVAALLACVFAVVFSLSKDAWVRHFIIPLFLALFVVFMGYTYSVRRFYVMAVYTLLIGILSTYLGFRTLFDSGLFLAAFGLGWLLTGAWGLRSYLGSTRAAALEPQE